MDDLRLKYGHMRTVSNPVLQVGGLFTIQPDGQTGPLCVVREDILDKYYINTDGPIMISNTLGSSLPILGQWGENLVGWLGRWEINKLAPNTDETSKIQWKGHTLIVSAAKNRRLPALSQIPKIITEIFDVDTNCEKTINKIATTGQCVAIVTRITYINSQKIGFKLADELRCIVPATMTTAIHVPAQPKRFTMYLSVAKDWFGLLDFSAGSPEG
ncbi:MAG: hypothetical protein JKY83_08780 [Rhizobiaceae bacterium]|nr:hypothetical protein [Rhizobiaceae bacterium]